MDNVGFVAIDDFCRNVANDEELAKLKASIAYREAELVRRAQLLRPKVDPMDVTRALVGHEHTHGDLVSLSAGGIRSQHVHGDLVRL